MSFPYDYQGKPQTDTIISNRSNNPSVFQPPNQMRNEYMHLQNSSNYIDQRYQNQINHTEEMKSHQGKPNHLEMGHRKNSNHNKSFQQEEARFSPQGQRQVAEGRTDAHYGDRQNSIDDLQYNFSSRDGPSPGRNYHYGIQQEDSQQRAEHIKHQQTKSGNPFRSTPPNDLKRKRKAHNDLVTPEAPRLISNQSSDDSINALLPSKRARLGALFPSESFMKSFTLSPMNSRTFSREDPIEMPRFTMSRGSAEGTRIFHSWSSGNSRKENHSSSDVRNCYDDWHSAPSRRGSFVTNSNYNRTMDNSCVEQQNDNLNPISYDYTVHGNLPPPSVPYRNIWKDSKNHLEQQDLQKFDRGYNPTSRQIQPLHPEDRFSDKFFQGYGQPEIVETNRPQWHNHQSMSNVYPIQHRDDIEDRSMNHMVNGNPPPPPIPPHYHHHHHLHSQRLSAPTPPVTNGWGRYGGNYYPSMYDPHNGSGRSMAPSYEPWRQQNMNGGYDGPYNPIQIADKSIPSYSDRISHLKSVTVETGPNGSTGMRTADGLLLLSLPEDRISLSETLCIVRENVEVFIATETDVKAPAPGRKRPVIEGQVGLRCIHCRSAMHQSEKVKRAVCFPSSIKRIYRTVIDMKLDHFKACRFVPIELKLKLEELRATNARSTGTTMQYFVQAAKRMGMVDGGHGISFVKPLTNGKTLPSSETASPPKSKNSTCLEPVPQSAPSNASSVMRPLKQLITQRQGVQSGMSFTLSLDLSMSGDSGGDSSKANSTTSKSGTRKANEISYYEGKLLLALPEDKAALSPLRCFLRENVCAFTATKEDIAVRTPTTFSVVLGQVGIGCIHCLAAPARERSNRAVCFPFSINRIYQSVADIQRFHFGECKMVPKDIKQKFMELQNASTKGSKGLATRSYWVSAAKKVGLVDTDNGIRFSRDPSIPLEKAKSLDILAQVASDVTTTAPPLVLPEDKPLIAGFLYLVMKQLQPCRFTEADRNKRRLKDVGCIGVECKHCAGQVDGRKFFWSSVNAVESNFVSVHTHMMECKMISQELKDELAHLKTLRKEQTTKLKSGSQKAFFARVWKRLHIEENKIPSGGSPSQKRKESPTEFSKTHSNDQYGMLHIGTDSIGSQIPSPPICAFSQSVGSPSSSIASPNSSFKDHHKDSMLDDMVVEVDKHSTIAATFPTSVLTTIPNHDVRKESGGSSINSLMTNPLNETINKFSQMNGQGHTKLDDNEHKVSVIEEI